jgi:hypothetical protein
MNIPRWSVGPLAATLALVALGFPPPGFFASGGGILMAVGVAFWVGTGAGSLSEPRRFFRHAAIVALYLIVILGAHLTLIQFRTPPAGSSFGGANAPAP